MNKINKLSKKQKLQLQTGIRALIQLIFFIWMPSAFTVAFAGVKYIFTQIGAGEPIGITSFVTTLLVLCLYTVIFGRFFCGFACAFGSFGDAVHALYIWICKKLKKKPLKLGHKLTAILPIVKYIMLAVIAVMCFGGVYGAAKGTSPWDVFSMIRAGNFRLAAYIPGIVILVLLIAGMCVQERFFCRFFCPMGAVFAILPVLPFFSLQRERQECLKGCKACTSRCPADIELPSAGGIEVQGECFQCQKCIDICPKGNVHCGIKAFKGNEIILTVIRAVLLLILFLWLGL
jgi:polyferredoxin